MPADVERDDALDALPGRVQAELGPVDILVNAAGVATFQPIHEIDPPALDRQWRINLRAPTLLCAAVLPQMRERHHGVVINVASEAGVVTYPGPGASAITKHGVCALTRLVAEENQEFGIRAWAICPGMVDTPMTDRRPGGGPASVPAGGGRGRGGLDGLLLQDTNVKMGPEILMRTMRNPWE